MIVPLPPGAPARRRAPRAAPGGSTSLSTSDALIIVNPHVYPNLAFKPDDPQPVVRGSAFSQTSACDLAIAVTRGPFSQ